MKLAIKRFFKLFVISPVQWNAWTQDYFFLNKVTKRDVLAKEKKIQFFLRVSCDFRFSRKMALKGSSFRMAEFLHAKSVIWLFFFILLASGKKTHERCSCDLFWSLKWLGMTRIGFLVKNEPWFEDKVQFLLLKKFKCSSIG